MLAYRSRPDGYDPDSCIYDIWSLVRYAPGSEPPLKREFYYGKDDWKTNVVENFGLILSQDFQNMGEVQQGMKSRGFRGARTNPLQESTISNFHRALREYVDRLTPWPAWDETYDFVIVGSGGGSMCAALRSKEHGKRALIIEKQRQGRRLDRILRRCVVDPEQSRHEAPRRRGFLRGARQYLDAVGDLSRAGNDSGASRSVSAHRPRDGGLPERKGMAFKYADGWSDYYDNCPAANRAGARWSRRSSTSTSSASGDKLSRYPGISDADGLPKEYPRSVAGQAHRGGQGQALRLAVAHAVSEAHRQEAVGTARRSRAACCRSRCVSSCRSGRKRR